MDLRVINESIAVAPQITAEDVASIKAAGYHVIVNNRPDDEEPGQPGGDAVAFAAAEAGIGYVAIPVTHAGISHGLIDLMADALICAGGPVLAYCRSGTRSCNLWALAAAKAGRNPDLLVAQAAAAGYDLSELRPTLDALAGEA